MEAALQILKFYEKKFKPLANKTFWDLSPQQRESRNIYEIRLGRIYKFITENFIGSSPKRMDSKVNYCNNAN